MNYNIDFSKYDLKDPNITGQFIMDKEGISRNGLYYALNKNGIKLGHRGLSNKAKEGMIGKITKRRAGDPFLFSISRFYKQWKCGAEGRNKEFKLEITDIINLWNNQSGKCALSGLPLQTTKDIFDVSLDRIDSNKPYLLDNVQLVLKEVNYMKQASTQDRFIELCSIISKKHGK